MDRAVYPLDTVKTRLQALPNDERPANTVSEVRGGSLHAKLLRRLKRWEMLQMLLRIIKSEGFAGVFKGFSANMINTFSQRMSSFLFFLFSRKTTLNVKRGKLEERMTDLQNSHTSSSIPPSVPPSSNAFRQHYQPPKNSLLEH
jgi:hypothetical protein